MLASSRAAENLQIVSPSRMRPAATPAAAKLAAQRLSKLNSVAAKDVQVRNGNGNGKLPAVSLPMDFCTLTSAFPTTVMPAYSFYSNAVAD